MRVAGLALAGVLLMACGCGSSTGPAAVQLHLNTTVQELHQGQVVNGVPCLSTDIPEHHLHVHLAVYYEGVQVKVPAGIGVGRPWRFDNSGFLANGSCFAWLHTHDTTGVIHIATPALHVFDLQQIFQLWGQALTPSGAFNYNGAMTVLVDGRRDTDDPRVLALTQYENIVLELGKPPAVAPASIYDFSGMSK